MGKVPVDYDRMKGMDEQLRQIAEGFHQSQLDRIREGESKTRHSILCYAIMGNLMSQSKQCLKLLRIYAEVGGHLDHSEEFDTE